VDSISLLRMHTPRFVNIYEVVHQRISIQWFVSEVYRDVGGVKGGLNIAFANVYAQVRGYI